MFDNVSGILCFRGFIPKDDKIVAVLYNDAVYSQYKDISDLPFMVVERLRHYFLTYKDVPGEEINVEISHVYGAEEAHEVINRSLEDYVNKFENLDSFLSNV